MALGSVRHDPIKVGRTGKMGLRTFTVKVTVRRSGSQRNRGGFAARACIHSTKKTVRQRCTAMNEGHGDSPTTATKKALHALAKKIR